MHTNSAATKAHITQPCAQPRESDSLHMDENFVQPPLEQETVNLDELRIRIANLEGQVELAEEEVDQLRRQSQQFRLQISVALMRIANSAA
jgi:hypothetical protein